MDNQQDDNKDFERIIKPDDILESAQKTQQDDKNDLEPEIQQDDIEQSDQETLEDEHDESRHEITENVTPNCLQPIFTFLTISGLVRTERVCQAWREFVLQYLPLVQNYRISYCNDGLCKVPDRHLSFRPITVSMRKGEIIKMIHKMGKYFVRIYSDCVDEEDSKALSVHCPHLEYLLLSGTHIKLIFDETDEERQKRKLTGVFLKNLRTNLKILGLSFFKLLKVEYLQSAVHRLTHLTRLDLNSIPVETLQSVSSLLEQMPLLEHLSLMEYERGRESGIDPPCFDRLSRLRELHLWGNEFVTDSWVEAATNCESLRVFNVGTCFEVRIRAVVALCQKRRELTELVVSKLRVTDADLEACVGYCRDLELLDASWCTRLTRNLLTHISRPNSRPLVVRLHGTRILESNRIYEGLTLRWDLPPELYNPLQVRYVSYSTDAEYVVLEHAIAIDLPDIYVEDDIRMEFDSDAEGDALADNAMHAEDAIRADDAIQAENDGDDDEMGREDAIGAEHDMRGEDDMRVEDDVHVEEVMHVDNNIHLEAFIDAEDVIRAEDAVRAENVLREENAIRVEDDRYLPIERRAEDDLRLDIPEEEIRDPALNFDPARNILRAMAIHHGGNILVPNGYMGDDGDAVNGADQENDSDSENDADLENDPNPENDTDSDEYEVHPAQLEVNGFDTDDDIYPEDDVFLIHEMEMNARLRMVHVPVRADRNIIEIDGYPHIDILREAVRLYPPGVPQGRGAADDRDLFADHVLIAQDEPVVEEDDEDTDSDD